MAQGTGIVTAVAGVTAVAQVRSLAQELPQAGGMAKKKKKSARSQTYPIRSCTFNKIPSWFV